MGRREAKKKDAHGISALWHDERRVVLAGTCGKPTVVEQLVAGLSRYDVLVEETGGCPADIERNIAAVLRSYGYGDSLVRRVDGEGAFVVEGTFPAQGRLLSMTRALQSLPGVRSIRIAHRPDDSLARLKTELRGAGLYRHVGIWAGKDRILVAANLPEPRQRALEAVLQRVRARPGRREIVFESVPVGLDTADIFESPVTSFGGTDAEPFIALENGIVLQLDSVLDNGLRVVAMGRDGIDLTRNDELVHLPLSY
jgi:type III secretion protein D